MRAGFWPEQYKKAQMRKASLRNSHSHHARVPVMRAFGLSMRDYLAYVYGNITDLRRGNH